MVIGYCSASILYCYQIWTMHKSCIWNINLYTVPRLYQRYLTVCVPLSETPMLDDGDEGGVKLWHLVKANEEPDLPKHRRGSLRERERERAKAIPEIYLTRLLSMKVPERTCTTQRKKQAVTHTHTNSMCIYLFPYLPTLSPRAHCRSLWMTCSQWSWAQTSQFPWLSSTSLTCWMSRLCSTTLQTLRPSTSGRLTGNSVLLLLAHLLLNTKVFPVLCNYSNQYRPGLIFYINIK